VTREARLTVWQNRANSCKRCDFAITRTRAVFGEGSHKAKIMLIGEAPGEQEDLSGRPFVGRSGKLLDFLLSKAKLNRTEIYIANTVKCRPPNNRQPTSFELDACKRFLVNQIRIIKPAVIVALGRTAYDALTQPEYEEPVSSLRGIAMNGRILLNGIGKDDGVTKEFAESCHVVVTYHPSYVLRTPRAAKLVVKDLKLASKLAMR